MPVKPSHILGMNARYRYTSLNSGQAKSYGFSKLAAKELLAQHQIPTPSVYHIFSSLHDLAEIRWDTLPVPFVIKPVSGSAGQGIWIIKKKHPTQPLWINNLGETLTAEDLSLHVSNILDGEFSTWGRHHRALVEEMIPPHPALAKYAVKGTPDLRVVVFNSVPIMAMVRIPTLESEGKANLDQGAIALGIDLATGVTTYGVHGKSERITEFPHNKRKVRGIKIPYWDRVLEVAVQAAQAAGYHYMGADLFIHPDKGPMVVELNGFPGLSIQLANHAGIKRRLERVEGLEVRNVQHGVKIAQALFGDQHTDPTAVGDGHQVIAPKLKVLVQDDERRWVSVDALVNTTRHRSAISEKLASGLGLADIENLLWQQPEQTEGRVPVIPVSVKIAHQHIKTAMVISRRLNRSSHQVEIGRKDLVGFLVGEPPL